MTVSELQETYRKYARKLDRGPHRTRTVASGIGGDFEAIGCILFDLVRSCGLQRSHSFVEVGCGSGRLTVHLSGFLESEYLGLEADEEARKQAQTLADRPDWRFEAPVGLTLPVANASVEMVCFFSVFTHLLHEESYLYLEEAARVLKPGGKIILSFLEFASPTHWAVFGSMVARRKASGKSASIEQFVSRDALHAWAEALDLIVMDIWGGDKPFVPLAGPVTMSDGRVYEREGTPGQSVCVLMKPYED